MEIKASLSKNEEFQEDLWHGIYIEPSNFRGFEHWKINDAISRLSTDYAHYSMVKLDNLSTMINVTQGEFEHLENAVYVPLIGKQKCESDLKEVKIKHQNICQIVVNPEKVLPSYLVSFLNSDLGCRILELKKSERQLTISRLNKSQIGEIEIALPMLAVQSQIAETAAKVESALKTLLNVQENLSLNPIS